jgi:methyl-accepting chemotaxis protein
MIRREPRRRTYIVNKSLQYGFMAMILIYAFSIVLFLAIFLFVPDIMTLMNENLGLEIRSAAADKMLSLHARVWPAVIVLVCLLLLHSFRAFHRVAGPLYRFRWIFEQVGRGDLSLKVQVRKKDLVHQEGKALNEMIEMLAKKMRNIQQANTDAWESLSELEHKVDQTGSWKESDRELLSLHRRHLQTVTDMVRYFRLSSQKEQDRKQPDGES